MSTAAPLCGEVWVKLYHKDKRRNLIFAPHCEDWNLPGYVELNPLEIWKDSVIKVVEGKAPNELLDLNLEGRALMSCLKVFHCITKAPVGN